MKLADLCDCALQKEAGTVYGIRPRKRECVKIGHTVLLVLSPAFPAGLV